MLIGATGSGITHETVGSWTTSKQQMLLRLCGFPVHILQQTFEWEIPSLFRCCALGLNIPPVLQKLS